MATGGEFGNRIMIILNECLNRLQQPDGRKRVQDKLRSIGKRSKSVNIFEPLEMKALRLCLPLVTDMLSDVVASSQSTDTASGSKSQGFKDKSSPSIDHNTLLIRFLYEAKKQSETDGEVADKLKQLQALIQQMIDAVQLL